VLEHAEDGCTASDIEDNLVLEQVSVLVDRVSVALGADLVFLWALCRMATGAHIPAFPRGCLRLSISKHYTYSRALQRTMVIVTMRYDVSRYILFLAGYRLDAYLLK
jgi:hypothetical protein